MKYLIYALVDGRNVRYIGLCYRSLIKVLTGRARHTKGYAFVRV